jgi:hypothetical protein
METVMNTQNESASKTSGGASGPMGMDMAKKMMSQTDHGGGPFETMQKMIAQMGHAEGKPPMAC